LHICCVCGTGSEEELRDCVKVLLDYGANPNLKDQYGQAPIMLAAKANYKEIIHVLAQCSKTDVHIVNPMGWTVSIIHV